MELTEWGVQDIWNPNEPNEVKAKYKLDDLVQMLKSKNGGMSIYRPRCGFDGEKKTRPWSELDGSGVWGPVFPEANPKDQATDPSAELPNPTAADAIATEPIASPNHGEIPRMKRSRRPPSRHEDAVGEAHSPSPPRKRDRRRKPRSHLPAAALVPAPVPTGPDLVVEAL